MGTPEQHQVVRFLNCGFIDVVGFMNIIIFLIHCNHICSIQVLLTWAFFIKNIPIYLLLLKNICRPSITQGILWQAEIWHVTDNALFKLEQRLQDNCTADLQFLCVFMQASNCFFTCTDSLMLTKLWLDLLFLYVEGY